MNQKEFYNVKEIAEILGVHHDTIRNWIKKYFPDKMKNGITTQLNQFEITVIKQEIDNNYSLRNVSEVKTELEMARQTLEVLQYQQSKIEEYKRKIESDKPKVDFFNLVADSSDCIDFLQFSKICGIGRNTIFKILRNKEVFFLKEGYNIPKQNYIDCGYFKVIEEPYRRNDETKLGFKTIITPKGQTWLSKILNQKSIE